MRITRHTDYALRVLVFLAARPGERVSTESIARAYDISLHHLQKVVRQLGEHGFLALFRGAGGGVELAQDPKRISIGAVVRALETTSSLVECFTPETNRCVIAPACGLKSALGKAQEAFFSELDGVTLDSVAQGRNARRLRELTGG
ncbi:MAG: Rrf2 family transcriptional regulator [Planctomycetota bacterium]